MTAFHFSPSVNANFTFQPTLDGNVHDAIVTWNLFGQRFYLNLYDLSGALVVCRALVGSPNDQDIDLVGGYFTASKMVFRQSSQQFEVSP